MTSSSLSVGWITTCTSGPNSMVKQPLDPDAAGDAGLHRHDVLVTESGAEKGQQPVVAQLLVEADPDPPAVLVEQFVVPGDDPVPTLTEGFEVHRDPELQELVPGIVVRGLPGRHRPIGVRQQGFFIPNKEKNYSVGQNAGMKLNASGGIEIHIAAEQPKGVPAENWLPITREDLGIGVIMRVYVPDPKKMKTWKAPKAESVK